MDPRTAAIIDGLSEVERSKLAIQLTGEGEVYGISPDGMNAYVEARLHEIYGTPEIEPAAETWTPPEIEAHEAPEEEPMPEPEPTPWSELSDKEALQRQVQMIRGHEPAPDLEVPWDDDAGRPDWSQMSNDSQAAYLAARMRGAVVEHDEDD